MRLRRVAESPFAVLGSLAAIYFITPSARSVKKLVADFEGEKQMYKRAHVFFSNRALARCASLSRAALEMRSIRRRLSAVSVPGPTAVELRPACCDHLLQRRPRPC